MFHQQNGFGFVAFQLADEIQNNRRFILAHARSGLVKHVDRRLERHQQSHFQFALIAVRQTGHAGMGLRHHGHLHEDVLCLLSELCMVLPNRPHIEAAQMSAFFCGLNGQTHILKHRQVGKQVGQLKGTAQANTGSGGSAQTCEFLAIQKHAPFTGGQLT